MNKIIPINTSSFSEYDTSPLDLLKQQGFSTVLNPYQRNLKKHEIIELCADAIGIIAGTEPLDAEVLRQLPHLKVISRCGAGMSNVDLEEAKNLGITVCNTPDAPTQAVAELTLGLVLTMLRQITCMDAAIRRGEWHKRMGSLLAGKRVGIVGYGRIGKAVARLLAAFDSTVAYSDPLVEACEGERRLALDEMLAWSDIVIIHASTGKIIIGASEMASMKKGSWLVNVARGECVDEKALYDRLVDGHLAGAALDVFAQEPYGGKLKDLDNVVLTPHVGSYARESRILMEMESVNNLLIGLGKL